MVSVWVRFVSLLLLIIYFGTKITKTADIIAEKKKWGRAFMGVIFISMITSFPELFTGLSAVTIVDSPDISVGEIVGSCIFNMFIIGLIGIYFRRKRVFSLKSRRDRLPVFFSLILLILITLALFFKMNIRILTFGISSFAIFIIYIFFIYIIFKNRSSEKEELKYRDKSLKKEVRFFVISAIVIIGIGIYLPVVGKELAQVMGWKDSFVGAVFLAFVTSFPELIVSFASVKLGAFDMLIGNIAGSNLFNIAIIFIVDIFYLKGNLISNVKDFHIVYIGIIAIIMNILVLSGSGIQREKYKRKYFPLNPVLLIILYLISLVIIFK